MGSKVPFYQNWKIAKRALLNPCMEFKNIFGWKTFFEALWRWHLQITLLSKMMPSPLTQFSKFNHFLWVCWFLGRNLSNFVPPVWKLYNLYCHNIHLLTLHPSSTILCFSLRWYLRVDFWQLVFGGMYHNNYVRFLGHNSHLFIS